MRGVRALRVCVEKWLTSLYLDFLAQDSKDTHVSPKMWSFGSVSNRKPEVFAQPL